MVNNPEQQSNQPSRKSGVIKQVLSGDAVVIRGPPRGGPPPEVQVFFSNVAAPKLARRANPQNEQDKGTEDEPYAWEAREFLRKKIIGKEVQAVIDHKIPGNGREFGTLWLVQDGQPTENVVETMVSEGFLEVKKSGVRPDDQYPHLLELEEMAKGAGKGRWSTEGSTAEHIRDITWILPDQRQYFEANKHKPIKAIIEFVRDACTVRALLLPEFAPVMIAMTGIRGPQFKQDGTKDEYADEAKFFTESRLLHRDVEVILESQNNQLLVGSIVHPAGSISEALVRQGFARCVDWSIGSYTQGPEKLRAAEKEAKEKKLRIFKNYEPNAHGVREDEKHYSAKVVEINNGDAITVKTASGQTKKIFLAGIRPPKMPEWEKDSAPQQKDKKFRPIFDIPYMFEAREFLRKKLIGEKVDITLDYVQAARATESSQQFPERHCCSVVLGDINIGEALLSKGLASIVYYRQDDEQRPSNYDALLAAEAKAKAAMKGVHSKKPVVTVRATDVTNDSAKAKAFLPGFQRGGKQEGVVEYVGSGSRFRVFLPKHSCVISLILAGVSCPKGSRMGPNSQILEAEEWGEEAMAFSKELCIQRDVQVEIDAMDKVGNFIGWLYVDGKNVSFELVQAGFASVNYYSAERSTHLGLLQNAEVAAKAKKLKIWSTYVEPSQSESKPEDDHVDRSENFKRVMVVESLPGLRFYAQDCDSGPKLESLMESIRQEFVSNPPLTGSYAPKRGDVCGAKFGDGQWYRAKIEALQSGKAQVLYVDYGNRETTATTNLALLPPAFKQLSPQATEYALAFVREPSEDSEASEAFLRLVSGHPVLLNTEYRLENKDYVTVVQADTKDDIGKSLVADGYALTDQRRERRFSKIMEDYKAAQEQAKRGRRNIWRYGDITEDDAKEFGYGGR